MLEKKIYLQWVGARHYPTIDSFCDETKQYGVSKRLPNLSIVSELIKGESIIFFVHNEKVNMCLSCVSAKKCHICKGLKSDCAVCRGLGELEYSTGGYAVIDGVRWDYTRYIKLKRQVKHEFWIQPHKITDVKPCLNCGGQGQIPIGKVFGFFVPEYIEYIWKDNSNPAFNRIIRDKKVKIVKPDILHKEVKRLAGYRKPGGFYAVTKAGYNSDVLYDAIDWLSDKGYDFQTSISSGFARLKNVMPYVRKQFRGLKRWNFEG